VLDVAVEDPVHRVADVDEVLVERVELAVLLCAHTEYRRRAL